MTTMARHHEGSDAPAQAEPRRTLVTLANLGAPAALRFAAE